MKILIDTDKQILNVESNGGIPLYSKESFEILSDLWLKIGWNEKYSYIFTWLGIPIIQLPEDMIRIQEVIYQVKPDIIIETGIAHGGSLIYYASLCKAIGKGRIIGVDIEIRPNNRKNIENHELCPYITLIEGSSTDVNIIDQVKSHVHPGEIVLVILDSNHSKKHVLEELNAYSQLITKGSYIVATDGFMKDLFDVPRGSMEWQYDNPYEAAKEFARNNPEFEIMPPHWPFNESKLEKNITHWPGAWLRKK